MHSVLAALEAQKPSSGSGGRENEPSVWERQRPLSPFLESA